MINFSEECSMLKKLIAVGCCAAVFMACETKLDPTNPESIRKHFAKMEPPIQMSNDQFISYVLKGDTASMSLFLVCSKDYLNTPNSKGNTALSVAVNKKNVDVVKYLLDRGAEIGIKSDQIGLTPLEDAATEDSTKAEIFKILLDAHKQKDPQLLNIGLSLHLAARYGIVKNVEILVENGANPNAKSIEGLTPLHEAAKEGRKPVVEYLVSKKVEINPSDKDGYTPIDWAEANGVGSPYPDVAKVLAKAGGKHTAAWRAAM
jgi:ankyrin repeat protein